MLNLVSAIQHQGEQVRLVFLQQPKAHVEPLLVARQVAVNPLKQLFIRHQLADLAFALEVPGKLFWIELFKQLDPVIQACRVHIPAQVFPGHETGH